jgi:hypothetical protein
VKSGLERTDFSVVVKNRARMPKPWRWEIYRAGRQSPIAHSKQLFHSRSTANLEGKAALDQMLKKLRLCASLPKQFALWVISAPKSGQSLSLAPTRAI